MKIRIALLFLLLGFGLISIAQNGKIQGRVYDAKNNESLPFTNIIIWGTNIGSSSDLDGNFTFTGLKPGYVRLAATSVGYQNFISEDIQVTNATNRLH